MDRVIYPTPGIERETSRGTEAVNLVTNAFSERKIFLFGPVDEVMLNSFTMQFLYLSEGTITEPIDIFIDSPGGVVVYGLAVYDLLQSCPCPVNMYTIGIAASMGAIILAGGQKGRRFILPHSEVMIHEPLLTGGVGGSASSIKSTADEIIKTRDTLNGILAKSTGKSIEEINRVTEHDYRMSATEAVEFGICDKVIEHIPQRGDDLYGY